MNTVTLSLEDYNELKAKADAYDRQMDFARTLFPTMIRLKPSEIVPAPTQS